MAITLTKKAVGPWPMNTYIVICEETNSSAIIDPGADAEQLLTLVQNTNVEHILITHGHEDHVGALQEIRNATGAPVHLHPADAEKFNLSYDKPLEDKKVIKLGNQQLRAIHTPGHTPGMVSFDLGEFRIIVGDTIFVGGPGKTWSAQDFSETMRTMQNIVFRWPDETIFFPGHGPSGQIGEERPAFEQFVSRGWADDLFGDVTWE